MVRSTAITLAATFFATLAAAATIDKRIVGGEDVPDGEIKFIVSLRDENGTHVCGGSLLDSTTVLTAAHCLISDEIQIVSVTAGTVVNILPTFQSSTLVQLMEYEAALELIIATVHQDGGSKCNSCICREAPQLHTRRAQ